jgi:cobalt-zinc-cadmium efflux system outer membrane protein
MAVCWLLSADPPEGFSVNIRQLLVLALAGACGWPSTGHAAESLRLEQAVARALASNPALRAEAAELQAAQARAAQLRLATPYTFGADLENAGGTGSLSGLESAEATLRLSRVLEMGGKRQARQAMGDAEVRQQNNAADAARLDIATRTTVRFIEVLVDQRRLQQAGTRLELALRTRDEVEAWVSAGRNPDSDLLAAQIAVADAQLEQEHAEHELAAARVTLSASWGVLEPDFPAVEGNLDELPQVEAFETLAAQLPATPEQRAALLEGETLAARRRLALADATPDVTLSLGVRRLEALDDQALVVGLSVPLGARRRSGIAAAEAEARLSAVEAHREAALFERHQTLFTVYQELNHARTEVETLRANMLPRAEQAVALSRRGFEAGRFSFAALAQAERTLFELQQRLLEGATRYHTLLAEVERLAAAAPEATP